MRRFFRAPLCAFLLSAFLLSGLAACGDEAPETEAPPPTVDAPPEDPASGAPEPSDPDDVAILVDDRPITRGEIQQSVRRALPPGRQASQQQLMELFARTERALIDQRLLDIAADKEGVTASEEEVAAQWKRLDDRLPPGMSRAEALNREQATEAQVEEAIVRNIRHRKLLEKHAPRITEVTDEQVRAWYDEHKDAYRTPGKARARHILLDVPRDASEEVDAARLQEIETIREEIVGEGGRTFEALAMEHSACPSKSKGGDLGLFPRGQMVPAFDQRAFELEPGVLSEPFRTSFGWHILEVLEREEGRQRPFEEVEAQIRAMLPRRLHQEAVRAYLDGLREAAEIRRPEPEPKGS